jgi:hypothetical protein
MMASSSRPVKILRQMVSRLFMPHWQENRMQAHTVNGNECRLHLSCGGTTLSMLNDSIYSGGPVRRRLITWTGPMA